MNKCQVRGTMAMEPANGDVWTLLNRIKDDLEKHREFFRLDWANAYLEPYVPDAFPSEGNDNFLTLKVRGLGVIYDVENANEILFNIVIDAVEAGDMFAGGGFFFEVCDG